MASLDDPVYDPVAAFAAGLASHGVCEVVISPGSRSTPLALTLHAQPSLRTWIQLDERSAGFFALGITQMTGRPAVLVCTSGTAAANYLPAVVEAHRAGVPMIVCTADRPPELRDWGAGQTIDQVGLYGSATRWAADLPVAGDWTPEQARIVAMRAVEAATTPRPGPVHLNWPFREPLEPVGPVPVHDVDQPRPRAEVVGVRGAASSYGSAMPRPEEYERGVIVVGPADARARREDPGRAKRILEYAYHTGWPIIAEPLTQLRRIDDDEQAVVVTAADHLLKHEAFAAAMAPGVVIRIGHSPTTKPVRQWLEQHRPERVALIDPTDHWNEASFTVTDHVRLPVSDALVGAPVRQEGSPWLDAWRAAEEHAAATITEIVDDGPLLSAAVARTIAAAVPADGVVMASNSMPVRDLDAFVPVGPDLPTFIGNRGASGIDGITSTALGAAAVHEGPVVAFVGDLALLHDLGALYSAQRAGLHLTIVCVDNDGGGIFSMLPIAARADEVDFETLFRTRHGLDLSVLGGTGGVRSDVIESAPQLADRIRETTTSRRPGVDLLVVPVDRDDDLAQRRAITAAVNDR